MHICQQQTTESNFFPSKMKTHNTLKTNKMDVFSTSFSCLKNPSKILHKELRIYEWK